jgi:NAD(P)H-hydrate epimerase
LYPKRPERMAPLLKQALCSGATELSEIPTTEDLSTKYDIIVDAIFGYSFEGAIRSPFDTIIATLAKTKITVISLDIPSGWDVEKGDINATGFTPAALGSYFRSACPGKSPMA